MSAILFVGNLPHGTTSDELRNLFSEIGPVESCTVMTDRDTGRCRGFGFVEMNSMETADAAKQKLDGREVSGRALTVKDVKPRNESHNPGGIYGSRRH